MHNGKDTKWHKIDKNDNQAKSIVNMHKKFLKKDTKFMHTYLHNLLY